MGAKGHLERSSNGCIGTVCSTGLHLDDLWIHSKHTYIHATHTQTQSVFILTQHEEALDRGRRVSFEKDSSSKATAVLEQMMECLIRAGLKDDVEVESG